MRSCLPRPFHLAATAVIAAVGVVLLPGTAVAECGSYVVFENRGVDRPPDAHPPLPNPTPCRGPDCSNAPQSPVLPLTAPVATPGDGKEYANRSFDRDDNHPGPHRDFPSDAHERPVRQPSAIFHPPRTA